MKNFCDLHTHSYFSDGTLSPEELLQEAENCSLGAIALTDHNTTEGLTRFLKAGEGRDIEAIAGIEFSVDYKGHELHLIALFIDPKYFSEIEEMMRAFIRRKEQSNDNLCAALSSAGYDVDLEKIRRERSGGNYINRAHIAMELVHKGYVKDRQEAFNTLLSESAGYYKAPVRTDVFEMIDYIKRIGAVSVLAHPFLNLDYDELVEFLPKARERGLVGMETIYSLYDKKTENTAKELCKKFGLLESGGSDFHGANKPDISLKVGKGNLQIPLEFAQKLQSNNK